MYLPVLRRFKEIFLRWNGAVEPISAGNATPEGQSLFFPAGHYYSPVPDAADLRQRWPQITAKRPLHGIDLNLEGQERLAEDVLKVGTSLDFPREARADWRYYINNWMFSRTDATVLAGMLGHLKPKRVIEVGSGFSSAVMLDTRDRLGLDYSLTFIEPYPERLEMLLRHSDEAEIIREPVQRVDVSRFDILEAGDVLFIDSTHVSKTGSDVNHDFFNILPVLKPGVIVHLHDIFYPFEYPELWAVDENRGWNELYLLRAFLTHSKAFEVMLWPHMLLSNGHKGIADLQEGTGSFWMRRR